VTSRRHIGELKRAIRKSLHSSLAGIEHPVAVGIQVVGHAVAVADELEVQLGGGVGLGLRESDTELKGKLDAAIQSMKDDGTIEVLNKKWFLDYKMGE